MHHDPDGWGDIKGLKNGKYKVLFRTLKYAKLLSPYELAEGMDNFLASPSRPGLNPVGVGGLTEKCLGRAPRCTRLVCLG